MATLDTSVLKDWPTAAAVRDAGSDVAGAGKDYHRELTTTHSDWKGLSSPDVYQAPHATDLFTALDCLDGMGSDLEQGTKLAGTALEVFSAWLEVNESARADLLAACEAFNQLPVPAPTIPASPTKPGQPSAKPSGDEPAESSGDGTTTNPDYTDYVAQYDTLKLQLDTLKEEFDDAVDTCAHQLDSITADGQSSNKALTALLTTAGTATLTGMQALLVNTYRQTVSSVTRYTMRLRGHDFKVPLLKSKVTDSSFQVIDWLTNDSFLTRLKNNLKDPFMLKGGTVPEAPPPTTTTVEPEGKWGIGKNTTTTVENSGKVLKYGGRTLFAVGALVTAGAEAKNRYDEVSSEHPEWSESQKLSAATEAGVVRGGSQIAAAAAAGAIAGSVVPVGGTAVGLVIGTAVGLAMAIPTGGGKSVGDRIGDAGEWAWKHSGASKLWHSIWH